MISATFTKRVTGSDKGCVVWVPKDVALLLELSPHDFVKVEIEKLNFDEEGDMNVDP